MELFLYNCKLAWINAKRAPLTYGLILLILAIGIGVLLTNLTFLYWMTKDPIPQKSQQLFYVQIDNWPEDYHPDMPNPPPLMTYRDAQRLDNSDIPTFKAAMYETSADVSLAQSPEFGRVSATIRATSKDFFALFNAPFTYGTAWQKDGKQKEVVISAIQNERLFGGQDSIGKTLTIGDHEFVVRGVLAPWSVRPRYYDLDIGKQFDDTADLFVPLDTALSLEWAVNGSLSMVRSFESNQQMIREHVTFLQYWVQLDTTQAYLDYQNYLHSYVNELKTKNLHPLAENNRLLNVNQWITFNDVVDKRISGFTIATALFLLTCLFNVSSLLLNRYKALNFEFGLQRAVGASRLQLQAQLSIELLAIGLLSGTLAILLAKAGLYTVGSLFPRYDAFSTLAPQLILVGYGMAIGSALLASIYPLWQSHHLQPSTQLKR